MYDWSGRFNVTNSYVHYRKQKIRGVRKCKVNVLKWNIFYIFTQSKYVLNALIKAVVMHDSNYTAIYLFNYIVCGQ